MAISSYLHVFCFVFRSSFTVTLMGAFTKAWSWIWTSLLLCLGIGLKGETNFILNHVLLFVLIYRNYLSNGILLYLLFSKYLFQRLAEYVRFSKDAKSP